MEDPLHGLNQQQRCAVTSPATVLQVLAPPGSGKTKTLTARVAYLISHEGLKPWNIIVCTFTIKAAREMKERIRNFVGPELEAKLVLGTFHSVARRYLSYYGHYIGIPKNFGIADSADSLNIIKRIIKENKLDFEPSKARTMISNRKSRTEVENTASRKRGAEQLEFDGIFSEYEERLRISNLLDYDDLLLRCCDLLRRHPECVHNVRAVLIDEFQDTNTVQYELMTLFARHAKSADPTGSTTSITIVGDPDQSIYSFRSAEIKNLKTMRDQYAGTHVVFLEENYRSSGSILLSATEVIEQDTAREVRRLLPTHCVGERPILRNLSSAEDEASWLVAEIQRVTSLSAGLLTFHDVAILLRSASISRHIETALGKAGIPYRMVGGHKFFDRVEVKVLLDYLRVICQPEHSDALCRIINLPPRGIGDATVRALLQEAEVEKRTLWSVVLDFAQARRKINTKVSGAAEKGLRSLVDIILTARKKLASLGDEEVTIFDLIGYIMKRLSYQDFVRKKYPDDFESRWANVEELILQASDASTPVIADEQTEDESLCELDGVEQRTIDGSEATLRQFLANVALSTSVEKSNEGTDVPLVTISTIHAAKGLEWPVVFIPATYEGSIPHSRAEDNDEERRLLYVGMTRAQALLYLSWPRENSGREGTTLSSFLSKGAVKRYFDKKGPSVTFSMIQDFARILRRICPSEEDLWKVRNQVEVLEDNHFPEDGEKVRAETTYYAQSADGIDFNRLRDRLKKRQQMTGVGFGNADVGLNSFTNTPFKRPSMARQGSEKQINSGFTTAVQIYQESATKDVSATLTTSKQVNASYLHTSGGIGVGFASARSVMQSEVRPEKPKSGSKVESAATAFAGYGSGKENVPNNQVSKKRHVNGQSSLTKYFGAK